jgi:hypothetical protein
MTGPDGDRRDRGERIMPLRSVFAAGMIREKPGWTGRSREKRMEESRAETRPA